MNNQQQNNSNTKDNTDTSAGEHQVQTKEEFKLNKKSDNTQEDNAVTSSSDEDMQSDDQLPAVSDGPGTAERKTYGDTELNKGLEAQAKDDES